MVLRKENLGYDVVIGVLLLFPFLGEIVHACHKNDPNLNQCLTNSANHLAMQFRRGKFVGVIEVINFGVREALT